jgi:hypothetical protein
MISVISRLISVVAKSQLQSDRTTEMFISFQNYCAAVVGDHLHQGELLVVDYFIYNVIK